MVMPKSSGLDIADRINVLKLPIKVIVLTTFAHKVTLNAQLKLKSFRLSFKRYF